LHHSTGGFIEDRITGLQPDTVLLYPMARNELATMFKLLRPKTVFVHRFEEWRTPFSQGITESNSRRAQRFARDVTAIDRQIKVIVPKFFENTR
jgi:hypothetical protein